jgi:NADH-quinone oxidoreductase subunit G
LSHSDCLLRAPSTPWIIRKAWRATGLKVRYLGAEADLNYPHEYLGADLRLLNEIIEGRDPLAQELAAAQRPMIILGTQIFARNDAPEVMAAINALVEKFNIVKDGWNGYNVLHHAASRVGALDVGFTPASGGRSITQIVDGCRREEIKLVYLLGVDEFDMSLLHNAFVIYQGHHGDEGAHRADIVLPGSAYTEKDATYVNMEGRPQRTSRAVFPPGQAREDWAIIRALSDVLAKPLPYNTIEQLRTRMAQLAPHLAQLDVIAPAAWVPVHVNAETRRISDRPLHEWLSNFYMTDPVSRASRTMAECTQSQVDVQSKRVA